MEIYTKNSVVMTQLGAAGAVHGVQLAPMSAVLKQDSAVMTPADAAPRKDANPFSTVARSGIRTEGPPV